MRPEGEASGTASTQDTTVAQLLEMIARLVSQDPHARCPVGGGPLAPVAAALNDLSTHLSAGRMSLEEAFGIRALVEQSPNIMFTCDTDSRVRYVNFSVPGQPLSQVLGTDLYQWIAPETAPVARQVIQKVLATGEPGAYEARPSVTTGAEWFTARVTPIKVGHQVVGFAVILTDISDLKKTQLSLEQSNRELESFAYVASHDLQEPLRKIQTFGERLKSKFSDPLGTEGRDYIDRMQNAAVRMRRLIDDLLAFSRVSSQGQPFTPVDLSTIAREVMADLEMALEQAGATITLGELPALEADPLQMRQLLQNLVGNALKFRQPGVPPSISIRGTVDAHTRQYELVVEDNGIGFEEKYVDRIFKVFQRLHGREQYEGTGIGLAICRKIAERHGGTIGARSTPGKGSTFTITLPLEQRTGK
ncbi:ATP-binding protein [Vitiosangium sp. GDMCC 1.1324]|uniref:PAS domain-containing sensor histidine kinase n=1 Tax=Vitiosangium sp. (strain GDMCC 1.1324) TaxID=2138576 RepID=UPI000D34121F|nr:ATP-binding protein [Vitiosangium sp. GDMCC 1.1324]PTL84700.1 PAS domain-containing sensor histidine kinase [Vitiosangium sp. GDMCC 1.1324]